MQGASTSSHGLNYGCDDEQRHNGIDIGVGVGNMNARYLVGRELIPKIGMQFATEQEAYDFYLTYGKHVGFGIRRSKSHKDKSGKFICRPFCCCAEGKRMPDKRDLFVRAPRAETRFGCQARMKVNSCQTGNFQVIEFVEEHNHYLSSPNKTHLHRSHRKISSVAARQIAMANDVGIPPKASHDLMVREAGGRDNVGFIRDDYKNYLRSKRTREMTKGDTHEVLQYLYKMQVKDPNFFYAIQVDEDDLITNIFWSDAQMRNDYVDFGDVVCFDTTYKKNSQGRPLALFVGVNHHKQTTVFGVALLYDETTLTFEWLFETFETAMRSKQPITILTYQDAAIAKALASTWPNTHHRLCIWHIYQNAAIHLSGVFCKYKEFARDLSACIYECEEEEQFVIAWNQMLGKYELGDNEWLKRMYNIKEKWALVYGRKIFCADMMTTQRSESMNSMIKRYVSYQHNLLQFFNHFQRLVDDRHFEELKADFRSNVSSPTLSAPCKILKHAATVYTPEVFKWFQDEWNMCHDYSLSLCSQEGTVEKYSLRVPGQRYSHSVSYDSCNDEVHCSCGKFEFAGIICSHLLKVYNMKNIWTIPTKYILKRWTKKAKCWTNDSQDSPVSHTDMDPKLLSTKWYTELCTLSMRLVTRAATMRDTYNLVKQHLVNVLNMVDETLEGEELADDENQIGQHDELSQRSRSNTEVNLLNEADMNFAQMKHIRGVKLKTKPTSRKRLSGGLEKSTKKRTNAKKSCTSTITPLSNTQESGDNSWQYEIMSSSQPAILHQQQVLVPLCTDCTTMGSNHQDGIEQSETIRVHMDKSTMTYIHHHTATLPQVIDVGASQQNIRVVIPPAMRMTDLLRAQQTFGCGNMEDVNNLALGISIGKCGSCLREEKFCICRQ